MSVNLRKRAKDSRLLSAVAAAYDDEKGGRISKSYVLNFTLVFLVVSFFCYISFAVRAKTFVWEVDGLSQHYLALTHIGQWFREILRNVFIEHTFSVPVWDFSIGAGGDTITTFNYYGLGDPLCLLSVLVPAKYTVLLYNFLILLRLYLAGLFFSCFCFYRKQRSFETILGACTYMFCGYSLYAGTRHPFFLMPLMMFPLFILGAEKILRKESPVLFILAVFISFLSNFYFSYMLVLLTVIYVVVRFVTDKELRKPVVSFLKFILFGATGVMMSCLILLPVLIVFLGNDRSSVERTGVRLLNDVMFYTGFVSDFMSFKNVGITTLTGFTPLALISVVVLFRKKGEHRILKVLFVLLTVMLMIPFVSRVMNGFAYEANRWIWGYAFLLSYISVVMFRSLLKLSKKEKITLITFVAVYSLLSIVIAKSISMSMTAQFVLLGIMVMLFVCAKEFTGKKGRSVLRASVALLVLLAICINGQFCFGAPFGGYIHEFVDVEKAYGLIDEGVSNLMKDEMDDEFSRYEQIDNFVRNASVVDGTNGVSFYWSLSDNHIGDYLKENGAVRYTSYNFQHLYKFTSIDALFSVKYFFAMSAETEPPYGYKFLKTVETTEGTYYVYENQYALPLGFTYSDYITREEYMSLPIAQRQEALLSNILLEEDVVGFDKNTYTTESYEIPFTVADTKNATIEGNKIITFAKDATITLEFDSVKDVELYLNFENLVCEKAFNKEDLIKLDGDEWDKTGYIDKLYIKRDSLYTRDTKEFTYRVKSGGYKQYFTLSTADYQNYDGIHDFLTNMGYSTEERNTITIEISHPGEFTFDNLKVVANPLGEYTDKIAQRKENTLQNVVINDNSFEGDISLSEAQLLFVSVPYSEGFTAYVDGEETEILRANTFGMALQLSKGEHHIEFRYHTRGLAAGAVVSLAGFVSFAAIAVIYRKKKKQ